MKYFITYKGQDPRLHQGTDLVEKSMFVTTDDVEKFWYEYKQGKAHETRILTITPLPEPPNKLEGE